MRLTHDEHPEAIKRYGHLKRGRGRRCAIRWPDTRYVCSRERGHRGPHAAHAGFGKVMAVWDVAPTVQSALSRPTNPRPRERSSPPAKGRPVGMRAVTPAGFVETAQKVLAQITSRADEIAFILLFIVFVKFAIDVLKTLY